MTAKKPETKLQREEEDLPEVTTLGMVRHKGQYAVVRLVSQGARILSTDVVAGPGDRGSMAVYLQLEVQKYVAAEFGKN